MKKTVIIIASFFISALIVSGSVLYYYLNSFSQGGKYNRSDGGIIEAKETKLGEPFNVLLLGVDIGNVGQKNSPQRSDTMMIFRYDPKTSEVSIVSIPRDTRVLIKGHYEKINAANVFGGNALAIKTVEELLNIDINYYVEINYEGFRQLIDAIGGIDVVIPYDMNYDDESQNLHIHFKKGDKVHLDGKKAEEFVRWRKNNDGTGYVDGDLGRIRTQQEFIVKVLEKVKSPSIILKVPSIAKILPQYIKTNMDVKTMLSLSKDISKINGDSMQKFTLQGEEKTIGGISYFIYQPNKNIDIVSRLGGKVSDTKDTEKANPKDIKIQILNGSGVDNLAAKVKKELEGKGYTVVSIGTVSGMKFTSSYIVDKTLKGNYAKQVSDELDIDEERIEKKQDTLSKVDVMVILGLDKSNMIN